MFLDWFRRKRKSEVQPVAEKAKPPSTWPKVLDKQTYRFPDLNPKRDRGYKAHSLSGGEETYEVNIYQMTCTCPDWVQLRSQYPRLDARRMCKHIAWKLDEFCVRKNELDDISTAIVRTACRHRPATEYVFLQTTRGEAIIAIYKDRQWVNVVTPYCWPPGVEEYRTYDYGYSKEERRWAYNERPSNYQELEGFLSR